MQVVSIGASRIPSEKSAHWCDFDFCLAWSLSGALPENRPAASLTIVLIDAIWSRPYLVT